MIQDVNVGLIPNDGTGDLLRNAFIILNNNIQELLAKDILLDSDILAINTILSDLQDQLDSKAPLVHSHIISDITGLQTALNSKVNITDYTSDLTSINNSLNSILTTLGTLSAVAYSNDYNDLDNLPIIPDTTGFVPYTGATTNVNLGEYQIKVGQIEFDQTPTGSFGVGMVRWNDIDGTTERRLKGNNVTLQDGQEVVKRVVNKTGVNLLESQYKVVRLRNVSEGGAQGQRSAVVLAQANTNLNSKAIIGVVTENISNNQEGFITLIGEVRGINTTGSLQSETWVDGDQLYLSATIAGGLTNIVPVSPNYSLPIATVDYSHITNGKISVHSGSRLALDVLLSGDNDTAPSVSSVKTYVDSKVSQTITNGVTNKAPSEDAVFDALALKQNTLTDVTFGSFSNGLTAKTTIVDADSTNIVDSADSNKSKKVTWLNIWTNYLLSKVNSVLTSFKATNFLDATSSIQTQLNNKKDTAVVYCQHTSINLVDSTNYFFGMPNGFGASTVSAPSRRFWSPLTGNIIAIHVVTISAGATSAQDCVLSLNNKTQVTSTSIGNIRYDNITSNVSFTGLSISVNQNDALEFQVVIPVLTTNGNGSVTSVEIIFEKS